MRILHVIPGIAPCYGGPSTAIGPLCAALNRIPQVTVELATTDANGSSGRISVESLPTGFVTHLFPKTFSERWKYSRGLGRWLRRFAKDYDLIHIHALWSFACYAAGTAARSAGVPYIVRPAGMLSEYTWSRRLGRKLLYWTLCERRTVFGAVAFHTTSTAEAKEVETIRPGAKTVIIPNGVDASAWEIPTDPNALRRICGSTVRDRPILLYLSRLHPKKGITDLLLPALLQLGEAFLAIVGGTDCHESGYLDQIRHEIDRLGLANRVALLGPVSGAQRWQLFDGATAFVLPSHSENFGIVVAEAMARGCPVVVSSAVQAAEHVQAAGAGKVVPLDAAALAEALFPFVSATSPRSEMGEAGRRYAAQHLTWDGIAQKVVSMYHDCA